MISLHRNARLIPVGFLLSAAACPAGERPNIILMMADDLGWGDPSYNGGWIDTPALDAMAAAGLRFDRFYSASAVCSPTRGSCLTGRHPRRLGIPNANSGRLGADETPLSEVLDAVGYATGHFGKWHLGTLTTSRNDSNRGAPGNTGVYSPPWHHGYDYCFATEAKVPTFHPMRRTVNGLPEPQDFADPNFYGTYYWTPPANPVVWPIAPEGTPVDVTDNLSGDDSRAIMDRVIPFVQGAVEAGDSFFAVVWFHTPHKPLTDPDGASGVDSADAYTNAIVDMDTQIARLRGELDTLGVTGGTMFWFCSDNGPENGVGRSGPYRERKRSLHEGGVRVPGLLVWPDKVPAGRATDFPAVTSDYYPTILDYLCIDVPDQKPVDGISLRGVIEGTVTARGQPIGFRYTNSRSWVDQRYKLISKNNGGTFELYDLLADGAERSNIAAANPGIVARMTDEFRAWEAAVDADAEYVPPAGGVVAVLSTPQSRVGGAFVVSASFGRGVTGLSTEDFVIVNGTGSGLSGTGMDYTLTVTPGEPGPVTIELPAGAALGAGGEPNLASGSIVVLFGDGDATVGGGVVLFDDHFDDGSVDGWISQGNARTVTHNIREAGSALVSEVVASQSNSTRGIASTLAFDPLERGGFTVTFVVDNADQPPDANGFFLGIVGDNDVFFRDGSTRNFGLTFFGTESRTNSGGGFGLNYGDNFASVGAEVRLADSHAAGDVQLASFLDGFSATVRADRAGWTYEVSGLNDAAGSPALFTAAAAWAGGGVDYDSLFGPDGSWFVVTSNQEASTSTHTVRFERIRLVAGAEPPPGILEVSPGPTPDGLRIGWTSVEGRRYRIDRSVDLLSWTEAGSLTASDRNTTFTNPPGDPGATRLFFRIARLLGE